MIPSPPLISVIIPCFNQSRFLPEAVESLRQQTHRQWECVIIDDGSTDNTPRVARSLATMDSRVRYIRQENRGLAAARNRGFAEIEGQYIQMLDADDLLHPEKFEAALAAVGSSGEPTVVYCETEIFFHGIVRQRDFKQRPTLRFEGPKPVLQIAREWPRTSVIPCHAFLFDARLYSDPPLRFDESLPSAEDWECWIRLFQREPRIIFIDRPLVKYRIHKSSMNRDLVRMRSGYFRAIRKLLRQTTHDPALQSILAGRLQTDFHWREAMRFGKSLVEREGVFRPNLLARHPIAWRLLRLFPLSRGLLHLSASLVIPSREGRMQRRWSAFELIGYNLRALHNAGREWRADTDLT